MWVKGRTDDGREVVPMVVCFNFSGDLFMRLRDAAYHKRFFFSFPSVEYMCERDRKGDGASLHGGARFSIELPDGGGNGTIVIMIS